MGKTNKSSEQVNGLMVTSTSVGMKCFDMGCALLFLQCFTNIFTSDNSYLPVGDWDRVFPLWFRKWYINDDVFSFKERRVMVEVKMVWS